MLKSNVGPHLCLSSSNSVWSSFECCNSSLVPFMLFLLLFLCWLLFTSDVLSIITPFMLALLRLCINITWMLWSSVGTTPPFTFVLPNSCGYHLLDAVVHYRPAVQFAHLQQTVLISVVINQLFVQTSYVTFSIPKMQMTFHEILIMFYSYDSKC